MNIQRILALALFTGASSAALAGGCCGNHCGGGGSQPDCLVTWNFADGSSYVQGDPLTYTGYSTYGDPYPLEIRGFTIDRSGPDSGKIRDGATDYSVDGSGYKGIGVTAEGEGSHWGGKIDNIKNNTWYDGSNEPRTVRDAILMDFDTCLVSLYQVGLQSIKDTDKDTDFEAWAINGDTAAMLAMSTDANNLDNELLDYDDWASHVDYTKITSNTGGRYNRTATINSDHEARFYVLISGANQSNNNDAFRMTSLAVTCDPDNCDPGTPPPGGGGGEAPIPGTLTLLGIGAIAVRRQLRKKH